MRTQPYGATHSLLDEAPGTASVALTAPHLGMQPMDVFQTLSRIRLPAELAATAPVLVTRSRSMHVGQPWGDGERIAIAVEPDLMGVAVRVWSMRSGGACLRRASVLAGHRNL